MTIKVFKDENDGIYRTDVPDDYVPDWAQGFTQLTDDEIAALEVQPAQPYVPQEIDIMQAELALHQANLLDQVNTAVAAQPVEVQIKWRRTNVVKRDNPMVNAVLSGLGLTPAQIDQLFINAAAIV